MSVLARGVVLVINGSGKYSQLTSRKAVPSLPRHPVFASMPKTVFVPVHKPPESHRPFEYWVMVFM